MISLCFRSLNVNLLDLMHVTVNHWALEYAFDLPGVILMAPTEVAPTEGHASAGTSAAPSSGGILQDGLSPTTFVTSADATRLTA